jgi:hypothetical protein
MSFALSLDQLAGLPDEQLVRKGLVDLEAGEVTVKACLVSIASPRLRERGLLPMQTALVPEAELTLYGLLGKTEEDPYGRYNSLLRRLVSFEHALDRLASATTRGAT